MDRPIPTTAREPLLEETDNELSDEARKVKAIGSYIFIRQVYWMDNHLFSPSLRQFHPCGLHVLHSLSTRHFSYIYITFYDEI